MKWYKEVNSEELQLDEPIFNITMDNLEILLPQIDKNDYKVIGYNWFNLTTGSYNSCCLFPTIELALEGTGRTKSTMFNSEIEVKGAK